MSFQKSLLALVILAIASSVSSTTCGSNPLLDIYGITAAFSDAQIVSGIKYCKSLKNKETCCDADTINGFQEKANALIQRLTSAVAKRDVSLVYIRKNVVPNLSRKLASLKDASDKAAKTLQALIAKGGSGDPKADITNSIVLSMTKVYSRMASMLTGDLSSIKNIFGAYQSARSSCVIEMVKIQAAAWCLACDPEYTSKGVSSDGIEFSGMLTRTLTKSCSGYFTGSVIQSVMFSINLMDSYLTAITAAFKKVANGDADGATEFINTVMSMTDAQASLGTDSMPVTFPSDCDTDKCEWIASTLFKGGELDEASLTLGGEIQSTSLGETRRMLVKEPENRRLGEVRAKNNRMLAASWNPDSDEAGVKVTFKDNPGNVDNSSGLLYKSIVGGLVVLFSVLLI